MDLSTLKSAWRRGLARLAAERDASHWAACAAQVCLAGRGASMSGAQPAEALAAATAAYGEPAMRSAMARRSWRGATPIRPALVALGAPIEDGWMARLVEIADPEGFRLPMPPAALGIAERSLKALRAASLGVDRATPLLWLCSALGEMGEDAWLARFEAARPMMRPCSKQEAAACLYLAKMASPRRAGGPVPPLDALEAWLLRWELAKSTEDAPALSAARPGERLAAGGGRL